MWPWVVALKSEVLELEVEKILHVRINLHLWQRSRSACELKAGLLKMIEIEMGVACGVDKLARL